MSDFQTPPLQEDNKASNRSFWPIFIMLLICFSFLYLFLRLGIWQVHRLAWKENLIKQVQSRILLPPKMAPEKIQWSKINENNSAYLPVKTTGHFLKNKQIFVTSMAGETTGYWWMMPFLEDNGEIVFVNRGFLSMPEFEKKSFISDNTDEPRTLIGLLRLSERDGHLARKNNPEKNIWYNRSIPSMAKTLQLPEENIAPYFIDAFQITGQKSAQLGLTKAEFPNNHLSYAITWFVLALGVFCAILFILYDYFKKGQKKER